MSQNDEFQKEKKAKEAQDKAKLWADRSRKWLIEDEEEHEIQYWTDEHKAQIKKLEDELSLKLNLYTTAAADAEYKNNSWSYFQLFLGFIATTLSFVNASAIPEIVADNNQQKEKDIVSVMNCIIGVVAILSTAVAERLKKKDYAVKASNLERIRVDYQGVSDLLKSEMAFPKEKAIDLEARVRRVIQDLDAGHIAHQPPPEIKEMFGLMRMRRNRSVCSKVYRWIKSWCFEVDPLEMPTNRMTSRASLIRTKMLRKEIEKMHIKNSMERRLKGANKDEIEKIIKEAQEEYDEIEEEEEKEAEESYKEAARRDAVQNEKDKADVLKREAEKEKKMAEDAASLEEIARKEKEKLALLLEEENKAKENLLKQLAADEKLIAEAKALEEEESKRKAAEEKAKALAAREQKAKKQAELEAKLKAIMDVTKRELGPDAAIQVQKELEKELDAMKAAEI